MPKSKQYQPKALYFPPRLLESMGTIQDHPLTLVEAPSGFGKTTALMHFFGDPRFEGISVHWMTFFGTSPAQAWGRFCDAIAMGDPVCGERLRAFGQPMPGDMGQIDGIFQDMACARETYIVLDDLMDLGFAQNGGLLECLSRHNCEKLHFVAVTTPVPGQDMPDIREDLQIYRIGPPVFTFLAADVAAYYRAAGVCLTQEQLELVHESTGGCVSALYLQLLAYMATGHFVRGNMDQLIEQSLWQRMDARSQHFFMAISITGAVTLSQAAFMSGMTVDEGRELLLGNGFVRADRDSGTFYLHRLFYDYLRKQFERLTPDAQTALNILAGQWAEKNGKCTDILKFYRAAGAYERIYDLLCTSCPVADVADELTEPMIMELWERTSETMKLRHPQAMIPLAFTLFFTGRYDRLLQWEGKIREYIDKSALDHGEKRRLEGELELILSFLEYNCIDRMSCRQRRALDLLGGHAALIDIRSTWTFGSPSILCLFHRERGALDRELALMDSCMPVYDALTGGLGSGAELVMAAEAAFMRGELERSEVLCHRALAVARSARQNSIYMCGLFLMARIAMMHSDSSRFYESIKKIIVRGREHTEDVCRSTVDLCLGWIYTLIKGEDRIAGWIRDGQIGQAQLAAVTAPFAQMIYGRILMNNKEYLRLLSEGEHFMDTAKTFPNVLPQIYTLIYMAGAKGALGDMIAGRHLLNQALDLAMPDGLYMPFAENASILHGMLDGLYRPAADREGMARIKVLTGALVLGTSKIRADKPELSHRERAVVGLVKLNKTNRQIAKELKVSISTVRTLLGRIFDKTGVMSRMQLLDIQV